MSGPINFEERLLIALKGIDREISPKKSDIKEDTLEGIETSEEDIGETGVRAIPKVPTAINLFQHPSAHPITLDLALLHKYDMDWFDWEPETLEWRIPQDFKTAGVSTLNMGKIQAVKTLHFNDTYWQRWEIFNWCTQPFNNMYADFDVMQVPSTAQIMVSVDISKRIRMDVSWSDEVKQFMAVSCRHDGIFCPPEPIDFLEIDIVHGFVDPKEIIALWPSVRKEGKAPTAETITAEQLRRNLDVYNFLTESRQRLQAQLSWVLND